MGFGLSERPWNTDFCELVKPNLLWSNYLTDIYRDIQEQLHLFASFHLGNWNTMDKNSSIAVGLVLRNENEIFGDRAEEHLGDLDPVGTSWKEENKV